MAVPTTRNSIRHTENGVLTIFNYDFKIFDQDDLLVEAVTPAGVRTTLTRGVDYTVTGVGSEAGGTVARTTAGTNGNALWITREVSTTQLTRLRNTGAFLSETHENTFDHLAMVDQQQQEKIDRCLKMPMGDITTDTELPVPSEGTVLGWVGGKLTNLAAASAELAADLLSSAVGKGANLLVYMAPLTGAVLRTVAQVIGDFPISPKWFGAVGNGIADDTVAIQHALNVGGSIHFPSGTYRVTAGLIIKGYTKIFGDGPGISIIKLATPTADTTMLVDSSIGTPADLNSYITIEDLEFDGNSYSSAFVTSCLNFFRVKNVNIARCYFHDTSGTPVNILGSQLDSYDINVSECTAANSKNGDAFAFIGTHINVYKCAALNFKDTGFAILQDLANRSGTNPAVDYPRNITFTDCRADGTTNAVAAGFAMGPYVNWNTLGDMGLRIIGCRTENCNVAAWLVATNGVIIENCTFAAHKSVDTGNVRLDGCSNVVLKNNTISMAATAPSGLYSALLIQAARLTYGASIFDADVYNVHVVGNRFNNSANDAIISTFESVHTSPSYTSKMSDVWFADNYFEASRHCIYLQPQTGSTASVCNRVTITGNIAKNVTDLLSMNGSANQFTDFHCVANRFDGTGAFKSGTGSTNIFTDSAVAWSPAFTGLTVTGSPIITGKAYQLGKRIFVDVVIDPNGGTTASAGYGSTYINNLPVVSAGPGTGAINDLNTATHLGGASISSSSARCDVVAWSARGDYINISASYPVA